MSASILKFIYLIWLSVDTTLFTKVDPQNAILWKWDRTEMTQITDKQIKLIAQNATLNFLTKGFTIEMHWKWFYCRNALLIILLQKYCGSYFTIKMH